MQQCTIKLKSTSEKNCCIFHIVAKFWTKLQTQFKNVKDGIKTADLLFQNDLFDSNSSK